jgi:ribose transport system substrate-binding protein
MTSIQAGDTPLEATVIYPSTQGADGIALARLVAQHKNLGDLASSGIPNRIVLNAPVVTKDNVEEYLPIGFAS